MPDVNALSSEEQLEDLLSEPYPEDVAWARRLEGDVLVLGAGGKMGPSLTGRIVRATEQAGSETTVYAVSRFSDEQKRERLEALGAETVAADLLDESALAALPTCRNVIYMVGMKFGATGREPLTWAMNAYLPGRVAERFSSSRIVAFSTGNVYPMVRPETGGPTETDPVGPVGEYAQSCLGRERVLEHFSKQNGTPMCLLRLNYAVEARYGVLLDIARTVQSGEPVSLEMGYVNVIWQGDANSVCFRALGLCESPADVLNVTGPRALSVRALAEGFAERLGREARFEGKEGERALLNDASRCHRLFGEPKVGVPQVMDLVARWMEQGGATMGKPTKFETKDGQF
jgi:nucleoside-diphosphate-sugar epimerase